MKKRTIRRLVPEDMPAYMEIYLNAYPAGKDLSDECYEKYCSRNLQSMTEFDHVNFYGMFESDGAGGVDGDAGTENLIATMKLIDFDMNLFGEMKRSTGLMALGVHPLHKRKGAARDMVKFFEDYTVQSGGAVSMLLPFRMDFYKKLGYGCGTKLEEYHIMTEYLPDVRNREELAALRLLGRDEADLALECHTEFVKGNHGAVCKFEEEVRDFRDDDEVRRLGCFEDGKLRGYAAFTFENTSDCNYTLNRMNVKELVYHSPAVLRKLLAGLRMQGDLAQSVVIRTGEADFYHLLDSCQDMSGGYIDFGFLQTNVSAIGTMYKICSMQQFFEAAVHRVFPAVNLVAGFAVTDDVTGAVQKFAVKFAADEDGIAGRWAYLEGEPAYDAAEVHVACRLSDLSALLMGSGEFGGMVRLGVMTVDKPESVRILDLLLHPEQKPFTNTDY